MVKVKLCFPMPPVLFAIVIIPCTLASLKSPPVSSIYATIEFEMVSVSQETNAVVEVMLETETADITGSVEGVEPPPPSPAS